MSDEKLTPASEIEALMERALPRGVKPTEAKNAEAAKERTYWFNQLSEKLSKGHEPMFLREEFEEGLWQRTKKAVLQMMRGNRKKSR